MKVSRFFIKEGLILGCIYMYTNRINGKKYIGQTTRKLMVRHWQHLSQNDSYIDKDIKKYGKENFKLEVLEDNIFEKDLLHEKERFYIAKYDTFNNGYNMTRGGDDGTSFSEIDRDKIIELIKTTNLSFAKIGDITGYSVYTVSDINKGKTLPKEDEVYPIRSKRCSEYFSTEDIESVVYLLQKTDFSYDKIADITETNFYFVSDINKGKRSFLNSEDYDFPIRKGKEHCKMTKELAESIIEELKKDNLSAESIGTIFNVPPNTVGSINRGKHSICRVIDEDFPIRKKQHKCRNNRNGRKISDEQLFEIIDLLLNTNLSTEEIARRYDVQRDTINRINQGATFKDILGRYKCPIRQNKEFNLQIGSVNE